MGQEANEMSMNYENIIKEFKKVVPFKQAEFDLFAEKLSIFKLKKNEIWEKSGKISLIMGFVNSGILRQYYLKDGNEFTDCFYAENEFIGNYISYLSKEPSHITTVALEPCELLVIPFAELEKLYEVMPVAAQFAKKIGEQKLFRLNKRNSSLLMDSPEERYYKLLEEKPDLHKRVPQYLIAQYLGIRPESLSRIRKRHIS